MVMALQMDVAIMTIGRVLAFNQTPLTAVADGLSLSRTWALYLLTDVFPESKKAPIGEAAKSV
jgi:hypothetical protein